MPVSFDLFESQSELTVFFPVEFEEIWDCLSRHCRWIIELADSLEPPKVVIDCPFSKVDRR